MPMLLKLNQTHLTYITTRRDLVILIWLVILTNYDRWRDGALRTSTHASDEFVIVLSISGNEST